MLAPFDEIVDCPALTTPPFGSAFDAGSAGTSVAHRALTSAVDARSAVRRGAESAPALQASGAAPMYLATIGAALLAAAGSMGRRGFMGDFLSEETRRGPRSQSCGGSAVGAHECRCRAIGENSTKPLEIIGPSPGAAVCDCEM